MVSNYLIGPFPGAHLELCDLGIGIKKLGNDPSLVTGCYLQDFLSSQTIPLLHYYLKKICITITNNVYVLWFYPVKI